MANIIKLPANAGGMDDQVAWEVVDMVLKGISNYDETRFESIVKGLVMSLAAVVVAAEQGGNYDHSDLRRKAYEYLRHPDFGLGIDKFSNPKETEQ